MFFEREEPDYRSPAAFDFVWSAFGALAREMGEGAARIDRAVLVARGSASGVPQREMQAAITILVLEHHLAEQGSSLQLQPGRANWPGAAEQLAQADQHQPYVRPARKRAYSIVEDVIARRTDGRPKHAEPLDAFSERLVALNYAPFRLWWTQTVAELRQLDATTTPTSTAVMAAALVEGALTFVVQHARRLNLRVFGSKTFDGAPRTWKVDDLVSSAANGQESAILDEPTRKRAEALIRTRQRIHAGRMLEEFPRGVPDLRPEEARDAKLVADLVVRRVLDWLDRFPPTAAG